MEETLELKNVKISDELQYALEKAKEFHPTVKLFVNPFDGTTNHYATSDNYVPDVGVHFNADDDLCHTEEHITIADMYSRLKAIAENQANLGEFEYDESDISIDDLDENVGSDIVDVSEDASDAEILTDYFAEKYSGEAGEKESVSAGPGKPVESKNEAEAPVVAENE